MTPYPPTSYGDGSQQYDFVYVGDVAQANICAMQADTSGECYNVGRGIGTSIKELSELLLRLTGSEQTIRYKPSGPTFVTNRIGSIDKAEKGLGFTWKVGLEEGMADLIRWRATHKEAVEKKRKAASA